MASISLLASSQDFVRIQVATMRQLVLFLVLILSTGIPCDALEDDSPDTNRDGVVDGRDDVEKTKQRTQQHWAQVRSTAPNSKLIPGLYVSLKEAVNSALNLSYVHVNSGKYVYYYSDINWQSLDFGEATVNDGWLFAKRKMPFDSDFYWHPHKVGDQHLLFSEQAWELWRKNGTLDPLGVLVRVEPAKFGRLFDSLPSAANISEDSKGANFID